MYDAWKGRFQRHAKNADYVIEIGPVKLAA